MFRNFEIISPSPDLETRLLLNVSHFPDSFTVSRLFRIFQILKRGLTAQMFRIFQIVSQFPDYFAFSKDSSVSQGFRKFGQLASDIKIKQE